ncbi:MAG: hypothetical protein KGH63_00830 [Candidatus Micrarchaeota archaeon]|nr:hypothetical protein [Candidatus Micrarchaeota archaeon]
MVIGIMLLVLPLAYAQTPSACSDGTPYGQCSTQTPGMYCGYDSSIGGSSLENVVGINTFPKCQCSQFSGYTVSSDGTSCVKTTCTDPNGNTLQAGQCASTQPKRCVNGQLADDPTACGCPSGQQASPDGKACVTSAGCRWNNPSCPANNDCIYAASNAADPGFCKPKQGCAFGTVICTSDQTCDTSSNANGVCKTKPGCQYLNPVCSKGQVCNPSTGNCEAAPATGAGSDSTLGGGSTSAPSSASGASSASPLSCCCLPTAGATGLVGLALLRRKDGSEE